MRRRRIRTLAAIISLTCGLLSGCGGGGGSSSDDIPPIDLTELLTKEKLITGIDSDKTVYKKGETIRVWFWVRNDGANTRTLTFHRTYDETGEHAYSYSGGFYYYTPDGRDYVLAWWSGSYDILTKEVEPGETIHLVDAVWDQVNSDGTPAGLGYYDVSLRIDNLYVDGRKLADVSTFGVCLMKQIHIQE